MLIELIGAGHVDHERGRVRLVERLAAGCSPANATGGLVERDDERFVAAVAVDDQEILVERRRTAVAVLRLVREHDLPRDLAIGRDGGRAVGAEMHVDAIAVHNRRRRRAAVLDVGRAAAANLEDFRVRHETARRHVVAEKPQRPAARVGGRRQPHPPVRDDGRRPSAAGHRHFPDDVSGLAPLERQAAFRRVTLSGRSTKLGPVFSGQR